MSQLNTLEYTYYGALGFTGHLNDRRLQWLQSLGATSENINDAWLEALVAEGITLGHRSDMFKEWLESKGFTGHVNDMWREFLSTGALANLYNPVAALDQTSISQAGGNLTTWTNLGSGGAAYNLAPSTGTLPIITEQGKSVIQLPNNANMKPAVQQTVSQPLTIILVAQTNRPPAANFDQLFDGRDTGDSAAILLLEANDDFRAEAGGFLDVSNIDTDLNLHVVRANGASSAYAVFNTTEGRQDGNIGVFPLQYITVGSTFNNALFASGWIGALYVYNAALTDAQISEVAGILQGIWSF